MATAIDPAVIEALIAYLPTGATVSTLTESQGETRRVRILAVDNHCLVRDVTHLAAEAIQYRLDSRGRIIVPGHGINAGDHAIAALARRIHGDTAALKNHTV